MDVCKRIGCNEPITGRQVFCSDKCRKSHKRKSDIIPTKSDICPDKPNSDTQVGQGSFARSSKAFGVLCDMNKQAGVLAHDVPDGDPIDLLEYATRTNPELLNHGPYMTSAGLDKAGLKANRVPIPGDYDYEGVCVKTEQGWRVAA